MPPGRASGQARHTFLPCLLVGPVDGQGILGGVEVLYDTLDVAILLDQFNGLLRSNSLGKKK